MYCKPDCVTRCIGPLNTVPDMGSNVEMVAGFKRYNIIVILKPYARRTLNDKHKFVIWLVIPEPGR